MWRRIRRATLIVGVVGLVILVIAARQAERFANRVVAVAGAPPSAAARALQASTLVADLHADPLLWGRAAWASRCSGW